MTTEPSASAIDAPLACYQIVGLSERWNPQAPEVRMPAGECWHCGTAIAYCVQIRHPETREIHEIGTTCAERVGLDITELKQMLADRHAVARAEQSAAKARARRDVREAAETAEHGPHGSQSRARSGCICDLCLAAAPHGTVTRFYTGCRCLDCIAEIVIAEPGTYRIVDQHPVIIDLATGKVIDDARRVNTRRYGLRWRLHDGTEWLPAAPKRRDTHARRGYVEAVAPWLTADREPIHPLGEPFTDLWGEKIPHQVAITGPYS